MLPWNQLPRGADRLLTIAALACLALGLAWSVDAATNVESYDEVERIDPWGERGSFTYAPILADGSGELPMGEPGYFTNEAPTMRVGFAWQLDDVAARRVTALGDLSLVVQHRAWKHVVPLATGQLDGNPGDALVLEGTIDLPATEAAIEATPGRDASEATWALLAKVRFASAPSESHKGDASEFTLPIQYTPPLYSLPGESASTFSKDHASTRVVHHEAPSGPRALLREPSGPGLVLAGIAGLAIAATAPRARDEEAEHA